jgi:hypothetical protein
MNNLMFVKTHKIRDQSILTTVRSLADKKTFGKLTELTFLIKTIIATEKCSIKHNSSYT